ncbi:MAG: hypothetical protein KC766_20295 [Myxococcales bacterium]|nr:hypothetical protein [Myxococcales bacterium]
MSWVRVCAVGAVSALGEDELAIAPGGPTAVRKDSQLELVGLRRPFLARAVPPDLEADPAAWLLARALGSLSAKLDRERPEWRSQRLAVVVGTSSGGMWSQCRAFDGIAAGEPDGLACRGAPYWGPLEVLTRALPGAPVVQVLGACASSALALGLARELLRDGLAELVIAGGYDAVTPFVAAGFEALGVTTADRPRPFALSRDGLALGEGALLAALVDESASSVGPWLTGFAASSDASHPTSPTESGAALARAAREALGAARLAGPVLLSAHATATLANDRAEASVVRGLQDVVEGVHAFKGRIGHTLGAGSALELFSALSCVEQGACPALEGELEPQLDFLRPGQPLRARAVLKLASAFGGANAALVAQVERPLSVPDEPRPGVWLTRCGVPHLTPRLDALVASSRLEPIHVRRLDALSALCATAALDVLASADDESARVFPQENGAGGHARERVGVVVGSVLASLEHNADYQARLRSRGYARADARRFPATSPNLAPGMVSILFGLGGPCTTVGAGFQAPFEALLMACELLRGGQADEMLVIVADVLGETSSALIDASAAATPAHGALALRLTAQRQEGNLAAIHELLPDILAQVVPSEGSGWAPRRAQTDAGGSRRGSGWVALVDWLKEQGLPHP